MKSIPMFPYQYKWPGLVMAVIGLIVGAAVMYFDFRPEFLEFETHPEMAFMNTQNLIDEVALSLVVIGLMVLAFSRERTEDEFVTHIRLQSLLWSFVIYYSLVFLSVWIFYNDAFWSVMIYHLFMPLLFYVGLFRFNYWQKMKS